MESRLSRTDARRSRAIEVFGRQADAALAVFELLELAWHDCYGELTPPEAVVEDVWVASLGRLDHLAASAHLAVVDFRDLRMNADRIRSGSDR